MVFITWTDFVLPFMLYITVKRQHRDAHVQVEDSPQYDSSGHLAHSAIPPTVRLGSQVHHVTRQTAIRIARVMCGFTVLLCLMTCLYYVLCQADTQTNRYGVLVGTGLCDA